MNVWRTKTSISNITAFLQTKENYVAYWRYAIPWFLTLDPHLPIGFNTYTLSCRKPHTINRLGDFLAFKMANNRRLL